MAHVVDFAGQPQDCRDVGVDFVGGGVLGAFEDFADFARTVLRGLNHQVRQLEHLHAKIARLQVEFLDVAVFAEVKALGDLGETDFIHAIAAVNNQGAFAAQQAQRFRHEANQLAIHHADELVGRPGGVGERSGEIKDRTHGDRFAHRRGVLHRGVVVRRENKAEIVFIEHACRRLRGAVELIAKFFHDVGAARARADALVAMLGDLDSGRRRNQCRCGGNVNDRASAAAGAAGVYQDGIFLDAGEIAGVLEHHIDNGFQVLGLFAAHTQAHEERGHFLGACLATHDHLDRAVEEFGTGTDFAVLGGAGGNFLEDVLEHGVTFTSPEIRSSHRGE